MKQKRSIFAFFAISLLQYLAANFAHPVTPTLIVELGLPDYMFGASFAAMSFTNFLFSPFWGKMREYCAAKTLLLIGCLGYAGGQFLFSMMKRVPTILFARCFSGFFVGAISVATLVYLLESSQEEEKAQHLAIFAVIQSLGAAFGYLIGGSLGVYSVRLSFLVQVLTLALSGVLYFVFLEKSTLAATEPLRPTQLLREMNPLRSFLSCKSFMTLPFAVLFAVVVFANFGTNAFDQCFNYYLKDQFQLSSIYNGFIKAVVGVITLVANSTICMWLIRRGRAKRSTLLVLLCCALSIAGMLLATDLRIFLVICVIFYGFNAIYIPLLQDCIARERKNASANLVMGFYNATKALGMICGALIAGFIYAYGSKLPFLLAALCFLLAALLLQINRRLTAER